MGCAASKHNFELKKESKSIINQALKPELKAITKPEPKLEPKPEPIHVSFSKLRLQFYSEDNAWNDLNCVAVPCIQNDNSPICMMVFLT